MNLSSTLPLHARTRGTHPAVVTADGTVTYADLEDQVGRVAAHLLAQGLHTGDVVAVALRDSVDHLVVLFATARAGLVFQPIDWRWAISEQERAMAHFGASLALVESGQPVPDGVISVVVDDSWHEAVAKQTPVTTFPDGDLPLLMSLSSGTTGTPKGPCLRTSQFLARFRVFWINLGFTSEDRFLSATPLYYGGGRAFTAVVLYSGGTVLLNPPPFTSAELCEVADRLDATSVFLVPTMLRRLLEQDAESLSAFRRMHLVLSSGAALHPDERATMVERLGKGFVQYYSSTEGGGISYLTADAPAELGSSVGRPVFGVEVQCVGPDDQPVPAGEVGRVRYRGPAVATEFVNDPEATAGSFRDGWFYPGDLATLDQGGYLHLRGRAKDMIIRGGVNIYPGDVEAVLNSHPDVVDCAVVGWPSREFNEEIAAFVVARGAVEPEVLMALCRGELARYKWPREIFVVDDLPRNALGKVVKADLSARLPVLSA